MYAPRSASKPSASQSHAMYLVLLTWPFTSKSEYCGVRLKTCGVSPRSAGRRVGKAIGAGRSLLSGKPRSTFCGLTMRRCFVSSITQSAPAAASGVPSSREKTW